MNSLKSKTILTAILLMAAATAQGSNAIVKGQQKSGGQQTGANTSNANAASGGSITAQADFDEAYYLAQHPDVAAAVKAGVFKSGWVHYDAYGRRENRSSRRVDQAPTTAVAADKAADTPSDKLKEALKDLIGIAEDLKIEQEDNTEFYKTGEKSLKSTLVQVLEEQLKAATTEAERTDIKDKLTKFGKELGDDLKPDAIYKALTALEKELDAATTDEQRKAVATRMAQHQRELSPWLVFLNDNGTLPDPNAKHKQADGSDAIRVINDRVTATLTNIVPPPPPPSTRSYSY